MSLLAQKLFPGHLNHPKIRSLKIRARHGLLDFRSLVGAVVVTVLIVTSTYAGFVSAQTRRTH